MPSKFRKVNSDAAHRAEEAVKLNGNVPVAEQTKTGSSEAASLLFSVAKRKSGFVRKALLEALSTMRHVTIVFHDLNEKPTTTKSSHTLKF